MKPDGSLLQSQQPVTCLYLQSEQQISCLLTPLFENPFKYYAAFYA